MRSGEVFAYTWQGGGGIGLSNVNERLRARAFAVLDKALGYA